MEGAWCLRSPGRGRGPCRTRAAGVGPVFDNGRRVQADYLIGADGVKSVLHPMLYGTAAARIVDNPRRNHPPGREDNARFPDMVRRRRLRYCGVTV